jgi:hypothetical protein
LNLIASASLPKLAKNITFRDFANKKKKREYNSDDINVDSLKIITSTSVDSSAPASHRNRRARRVDGSDELSSSMSRGEVCVCFVYVVLYYLFMSTFIIFRLYVFAAVL